MATGLNCGADHRRCVREFCGNRQRLALFDGRRPCRLRPCLARRFCNPPPGANVPEQLFYPNVRVDDHDRPLSGANNYVLRFDKDRIPPVSVFWNLSMYDDKEFFIENDFKRYSIGSTTDGLKTEAEGSITIYIQHDNPGKAKQSNWLPAPAGSFNLTMRLYVRKVRSSTGRIRLPAVKRAA